MLTWRDIWVYMRMLIRWWWVGLICVGLSAGIAYAIARQQPDYYQARAVLMVGENFSAAAPDQYAFGLSNTLAQFYVVMASREAILRPVTEQLQLPFSWETLSWQIYATVNSQANLVEIWVTDTDPDRATAIAAAIANELIKFSPNSPEKIAEQRMVFEQQITEAEQSLKGVETRLSELQAQQATLVSAVDLRAIDEQIAELQKVRDRSQDTYNQLLELRSSGSVNTLSVFEEPTRPEYPLPSRRMLTVAVAGAGGLVLALLAILLLEALDDRWRTGRDLRNRFGLSDLGAIPAGRPDDSTAELKRENAVRDAHTRILLAALERGTRLLLVTSPQPNEARSAFIVDMARLFTRSGYRVLLVDADMSEPHLTNLVGRSEPAVRPAVVHNADVKVWSQLQPTHLENVLLLGRHIGPDGKPMVPSLPWPDLVQSLNRAADVIIFDGPSALSSADAALLAPLVDGIVLTLDPINDRRGAIMESKNRLLRRKGVNLLGAVVLEPGAGVKRGRHPALTTEPARPQLTTPPATPPVAAADTPANGVETGVNPGLSSAMAQAIGRGLLLPPGSSPVISQTQAPETIQTVTTIDDDVVTIDDALPAAPAGDPSPALDEVAAPGQNGRRSRGSSRSRRERAIMD